MFFTLGHYGYSAPCQSLSFPHTANSAPLDGRKPLGTQLSNLDNAAATERRHFTGIFLLTGVLIRSAERVHSQRTRESED